MNGENLSQLQMEELKLLKIFTNLYDKNNLIYFLCGGSFLGAVRHQGFIPWDDDIDVAMPRPDFEKFLQIAPNLLPDDTFLSTYKRGKEHVTVPKDYYGKGTTYKFEDIYIECPDKLDYLVHFYGDYMTPPPVNERNRHNVTVINMRGYRELIYSLLNTFHLHIFQLNGRCV